MVHACLTVLKLAKLDMNLRPPGYMLQLCAPADMKRIPHGRVPNG